MPSPVAHGFAGLALAQFAVRKGFVGPGRRFWMAALAFAAIAPDLDFVPGLVIGNPYWIHHGVTHTVIAGVVFGLLAGGSARLAGFAAWRSLAVLTGLGYLSHLLLDLITVETDRPTGMTLLRPFTSFAVRSPVHVFLDIRYDPTAGSFLQGLLQWHNARAVAWELVIIGGIWAAYRGASSAPLLARPSSREGTSNR